MYKIIKSSRTLGKVIIYFIFIKNFLCMCALIELRIGEYKKRDISWRLFWNLLLGERCSIWYFSIPCCETFKNIKISRLCSQRSMVPIRISNRTAIAALTMTLLRIKIKSNYAAVINKLSRKCWSLVDNFIRNRYIWDNSMARMKEIKKCYKMLSVS